MRSRAAYRGIGAWHGETRAMLHIADLRLALGEVDDALAIGEESAARLNGRNHRDDHGRALANLGAAWLACGEIEAARSCWERALDELRGLDFSYWVFDHIAALAIAEGREHCAAQMIGYANAGYARLRKGKRVQNEQRAHTHAMAHLASHLDSDRLATLLAVGATAAEDDVRSLALTRPTRAQSRTADRAGGAGESA
jgi:tetratricopeptide (TPR) repeat protein